MSTAPEVSQSARWVTVAKNGARVDPFGGGKLWSGVVCIAYFIYFFPLLSTPSLTGLTDFTLLHAPLLDRATRAVSAFYDLGTAQERLSLEPSPQADLLLLEALRALRAVSGFDAGADDGRGGEMGHGLEHSCAHLQVRRMVITVCEPSETEQI